MMPPDSEILRAADHALVIARGRGLAREFVDLHRAVFCYVVDPVETNRQGIVQAISRIPGAELTPGEQATAIPGPALGPTDP
jgi:hypothetical protein